MPLFLEPNKAFEIALDCDKDKPADVRPVFISKSLSMRQQTELGEKLDKLSEFPTLAEGFAATCKLFYEYVSDWRNMGEFKYGCDIQEFMSHAEVREVLRKVLANQHVQPEEKKS
jgi:hypothetical protein